MAFPTTLDSFTNPTAGNRLDDPGVEHATQHAQVNNAVEAIEAILGTTAVPAPSMWRDVPNPYPTGVTNRDIHVDSINGSDTFPDEVKGRADYAYETIEAVIADLPYTGGLPVTGSEGVRIHLKGGQRKQVPDYIYYLSDKVELPQGVEIWAPAFDTRSRRGCCLITNGPGFPSNTPLLSLARNNRIIGGGYRNTATGGIGINVKDSTTAFTIQWAGIDGCKADGIVIEGFNCDIGVIHQTLIENNEGYGIRSQSRLEDDTAPNLILVSNCTISQNGTADTSNVDPAHRNDLIAGGAVLVEGTDFATPNLLTFYKCQIHGARKFDIKGGHLITVIGCYLETLNGGGYMRVPIVKVRTATDDPGTVGRRWYNYNLKFERCRFNGIGVGIDASFTDDGWYFDLDECMNFRMQECDFTSTTIMTPTHPLIFLGPNCIDAKIDISYVGAQQRDGAETDITKIVGGNLTDNYVEWFDPGA